MQVPLPPWNKPARQQRQEAEAFGFMKRVVVDGDAPQDVDRQIAITMAGFVLGALNAMHERAGMTAQQADAASKRMIADQARLMAAQVAMLSPEDQVPSGEDDGGQEARRDSEGDS